MLPSPYRAAAAYDGYIDMEAFAAEYGDEAVPYDRVSPDEVRLRNPQSFASSIRCPLRLYVGDACRDVNRVLAQRAKQAGKDCTLVDVGGDHHQMVAPAVQNSILWFDTLK